MVNAFLEEKSSDRNVRPEQEWWVITCIFGRQIAIAIFPFVNGRYHPEQSLPYHAT